MALERKNIIVMITLNEVPVVRGNFKKLCLEYGFPYHSLKMKPFPIIHENFIIHRLPFK
jgi:hypothetical protein